MVRREMGSNKGDLTCMYTFFDKFNTEFCLNRYDNMIPLFFKIALEPL